MTVFARVVFALPFDQSFLYAVPEEFRAAARPGSRVVAPLGTRRQNGFIVGLTTEPPAAGIKVKELVQVLDDRPFRDERFLEFTGRLSAMLIRIGSRKLWWLEMYRAEPSVGS
jgi:primosomal protein N' (replication factor Y)